MKSFVKNTAPMRRLSFEHLHDNGRRKAQAREGVPQMPVKAGCYLSVISICPSYAGRLF